MVFALQCNATVAKRSTGVLAVSLKNNDNRMHPKCYTRITNWRILPETKKVALLAQFSHLCSKDWEENGLFLAGQPQLAIFFSWISNCEKRLRRREDKCYWAEWQGKGRKRNAEHGQKAVRKKWRASCWSLWMWCMQGEGWSCSGSGTTWENKEASAVVLWFCCEKQSGTPPGYVRAVHFKKEEPCQNTVVRLWVLYL